jgi:hypothetical protein
MPVWRTLHEEYRIDLYYSRIHESTPYYNCHAAGIEVTLSEQLIPSVILSVVTGILCLGTCYLATLVLRYSL